MPSVRNPLAMVVPTVLLAACGAAPALPPPAASGTVVIHVWDQGAAQPTAVVAERIAQEGQHFDRFLITRVRSRVVMSGIDLAVTAPSGVWTTRTGVLDMEGPVHFAGSWQGRPVVGTANAARMARDSGSLELADLEMWNQGQRLTAPVAVLRRDHVMSAPRGMTSTALPPELAAVFAALPDPLAMPR